MKPKEKRVDSLFSDYCLEIPSPYSYPSQDHLGSLPSYDLFPNKKITVIPVLENYPCSAGEWKSAHRFDKGDRSHPPLSKAYPSLVILFAKQQKWLILAARQAKITGLILTLWTKSGISAIDILKLKKDFVLYDRCRENGIHFRQIPKWNSVKPVSPITRILFVLVINTICCHQAYAPTLFLLNIQPFR